MEKCTRCGKTVEDLHKENKHLNIESICGDCWKEGDLDMWNTTGVPDPDMDET